MLKFFQHKLSLRQTGLFFGFLVFFTITRWNGFNMPFERDEGVYAYIASRLSSGELPYIDIFDHKTPLIYFVFFLSQLIGGNRLWAPRLLAYLSTLLSVIVCHLIVKTEIGEREAKVFPWIMTILLTLPLLTSAVTNTEVFMILPLSVSFLIYVWKKGDSSFLQWFLFGVFSALAVYFKPICLFTLFFILAIWSAETWIKNGPKQTLGKIVCAILGSLLISLLVLMPFLLKDKAASFINSVIVYNWYYYSQGKISLGSFFQILLSTWPLLLLLFFIYLYKRPKRWVFHVGLIVFSSLGVLKGQSGHYFILLIPFLSIITTCSLLIVYDHFLCKTKNIKPLFCSLVVLTFILPALPSLTASPEKLSFLYYGKQPFAESLVIAEDVKKLSSPDDFVYIAGAEPQVLYYSERISPSHLIYNYPLLVVSPNRENFQKELIQDLEKEKPELIVYSPSDNNWKESGYMPSLVVNYLSDLIMKDYEIYAYYSYASKGNVSGKVSLPEKESMDLVSFILYKKN